MEKECSVEILRRLNKVLHKLKYCSAELSEIESVVTELNPGAHGDEMEAIEERPDLLIIAGILRETMNSLRAGLERVRDVHNMQVPVLRLNNLEEANSMRSRPSPVLDSSNPADANKVTLLDYGAGNVRSIRNAIHLLGFKIREVNEPEDISKAKRLIFPGVGSIKSAMGRVRSKRVGGATHILYQTRPAISWYLSGVAALI